MEVKESNKKLEIDNALITLKALTDAMYEHNNQSQESQGYKGDFQNAIESAKKNPKIKGAINCVLTIVHIREESDASEAAKNVGFSDLKEVADLYWKYRDYWELWKKMGFY